MFLVAGGITVFAGILFYVAMPAGPGTAWFLTPEERIIAAKRLASQHDGGDKTSFSMAQFKEACLDLKTVHVFMFGVLVTMCSPVLTFASLVIKNLVCPLKTVDLVCPGELQVNGPFSKLSNVHLGIYIC
jgi:hypothetical protein